MATILKQPSGLSFTGTMDDLSFKTSAVALDVILTVKSSYGTEKVISETYYPDSSGTITLSDLGDLLEPYCRQYGSITVSAEYADVDAEGTKGTSYTTELGTVLFGTVDVQESASAFCDAHFLTILNGPKETAYGRTECLSAYSATSLTVTATVYSSTTKATSSKTATLSAINTTGSVSDFNVSASAVASAVGIASGETLLGYVCTAGSRSQEYIVIEDEIPPSPAMCFLNSFGCWEYIYCTGTHTKDSKYERSSARVSGMTRNYKITETREFKAKTGVLNEAMADWADDLFRSQSVYLFNGGKMGKEVVITDSKSEITNEDDNMPSFEFTWQYSQKLHNIMDVERERVFDATFDYTFE